MGYRDRSVDVNQRDLDADDQRYRESNRRFGRGYGDDYRGYSRGYNVGREPNYRTERDEGYTGWGTQSDANYGRGYSPSNRWPSSEADRWETRNEYYNQGAQRSHLRCRDIMTRNVTTCQPDTGIVEVARIMRDDDVGAVPVISNGGKLEGIITDRDIIVSGLTSDKNDAELRAGDCMSTDLYTANQNDRLVDVINEMGDHKIRRIPVVDSRERLVGIISMADIATDTNKDLELASALKDVSQPASWLTRLANLFR